MKVRLQDVADRAGVSISTVSRVVNEKPEVNERTRRAVLSAIDVLGLEVPHRLRARTTGLVGVIVPELENPFFPRLAQALENSLDREGFTTVLCSQSIGGVPEDVYIETLLGHGVSGIVFVSGVHAVVGSNRERYRRLTATGLPVVLVNGRLLDVGAACVGVDDAAMVDLAVSHLANMGHRRIGFTTGQHRYVAAQNRARAFVTALATHVGIDHLTSSDAEELVEHTTFTIEGGEQAAVTLLGRGVTAIVCGSDVMALGAIRGIRSQGMRVPEDVSVVGADDSMLVSFTDPPLTTVRQPALALAQHVARTLSAMVAGDVAPQVEVLLQPELVARASSARAPG